MGVILRGFDEVTEKLDGFFDNWDEELKDVGDVVAQTIVSETLDGRGADDQPFAPYSDSYQKQLDRAGGKPPPVDLRGILPHTGPRTVRRPARGLTDPDSEMSLDLLTVTVAENVVTIRYMPRETPYMIFHNDGTGTAPRRQWFTLKRQAVHDAAHNAVSHMLDGCVRRFNEKGPR